MRMWFRVIGLMVSAWAIFWAGGTTKAASVTVENASFELPAIDPCDFPVLPYAYQWRELDVDTEYSTNTGVFVNTAPGSPDRVLNADGVQLAFLGSELGNGFEQDLTVVYQEGRVYRLTVGVGISMRFPPSETDPVDTLELALYYLEGATPVDIVQRSVPATGLSWTLVQDFEVQAPAVQASDAWAGQDIGVAIRATGAAGGFWTLENVRLMELSPSDFTGDSRVNLEDFAVMAQE